MPEMKEWTLMFYFASDNPLAPSVVSQLKAIKDAGFHDQANVIARFDPHADRTPGHIFDVNLLNKLESGGKPQVGFINTSFVRNLAADKLWGDEVDVFGGLKQPIRDRLKQALASRKVPNKDITWEQAGIEYKPPILPPEMQKEQHPKESLRSFLEFCKTEYPAHRYMLFILGHGLVVGNDLFLFDENTIEPQVNASASAAPTGKEDDCNGKKTRPRNALLLTDLGCVLRKFRESLPAQSEFALMGFHSCSMSALEVAFELQNTATFMMASQGPAFVGSWPYRQILIRILKDLQTGRRRETRETLQKVFFYCLYNSYDFQLAGYSCDLTLCDLSRIDSVKEPLHNFTEALMDGLNYKEIDPMAEDLILLAHWEAQSYWQESCTDLRDFCLRLTDRCRKVKPGTEETGHVIGRIAETSDEVIKALKKGSDNFIVLSECGGPAYQYSHGMSVYFPWSEPVGNRFWEEEYKEYRMNAESAKDNAWRDFLKLYFDQTKRQPRADEDAQKGIVSARPQSFDQQILSLVEEITTQIFNDEGQLGKGGATDATGLPSKAGSGDPTGGDCECLSIKNYPATTRAQRRQEAATVRNQRENGMPGPTNGGKVPFSASFFDMIDEDDLVD